MDNLVPGGWPVLAALSLIITLLAGIVGHFVHSVRTGELVPRKTVEHIQAMADLAVQAAAGNASQWHAAWETSERGRAVLAAQQDTLLESARATAELADMVRTGQRRSRGGG